MATISAALAIALEHHRAGRLELAEVVYRQILQADPSHAEAWHLLGVVAHQLGQHQAAVEDISRAIRLDADKAEYHNDLGVTQQAAGQIPAAIAAYERAIQIAPEYADACYNLGNALRTAGELAKAIACYERTVQLKPEFAAAYNNLGNALKDQGQLVEAIASYEHALQIAPDFAEAHCNLGITLQAQGRLPEATVRYRRALQLNPALAAAHNNLGSVLKDQGQLDEAVACCRRAIQLQPHHAEAHSNLAIALQEQGRLDEAIACYERAVQIDPQFDQAFYNLGNAWRCQGRFTESIACFQRAIQLKPAHAAAHRNLGLIAQDQGRLVEAIACYRQAIQADPEFAEAHNSLGLVLQMQNRIDEAIACYQRAIQLKPEFAAAHGNLGMALQSQEKLSEAIVCYRQALQLNPASAQVHNNLGNALKDQGRLAAAIASYRRAIELKPEFAAAHSNLVYTLLFCPGWDAQAIYDEHCRWNREHAADLAARVQPHANDRSPNRRLRVGYVSPFFQEHCQAFFMTPLLSAHDRENFEVFGYADVPGPDSVTAQLRSHADVWRDIAGLTDERIAQLIRDDRVDILVDLTMHMGAGRPRLFARKPAPVQVCWLAYPGTTGLSTIDYRLTDPYLDPPGLSDHFYAEESIRLPDTFWCYDPLTDGPAVNALPALQQGCVTFGNLNNFCKVNKPVLELWARVLRAVEHSRLLMLSPEGDHRREIEQLFEREGVAPDRVTFIARQPRQQYLELYHRIDLGLDTFPYNGHTTSLDSYWMGVPVVTIVGPTVVGRAGLSQLTNLGLTELVAKTPDQFVAIAAGLARDLASLDRLRATLRQRMQQSPLMDALRFAHGIEAAYRTMWQRWCAGQ
jgi:protein O-GlcNAc transferase